MFKLYTILVDGSCYVDVKEWEIKITVLYFTDQHGKKHISTFPCHIIEQE